MRRAAWALVLGACAKSPLELAAGQKLPPARVATRGELVLKCVPDDAEVLLDGVPQGTCADFAGEPWGLKLKQGRVEVKKQGFLPWNSQLETDGTRVVMNVTLISTGGTP